MLTVFSAMMDPHVAPLAAMTLGVSTKRDNFFLSFFVTFLLFFFQRSNMDCSYVSRERSIDTIFFPDPEWTTSKIKVSLVSNCISRMVFSYFHLGISLIILRLPFSLSIPVPTLPARHDRTHTGRCSSPASEILLNNNNWFWQTSRASTRLNNRCLTEMKLLRILGKKLDVYAP